MERELGLFVSILPLPVLSLSDWRTCYCVGSDKTIRLWDAKPRTETAKLLHNAHIVTMSWMEYDKGVLTLCDDGSVNTWMLQVIP